ncbi:hypothetical protein ElyMa_006035800 [Elysia marginata]|uniref:Uncharacterized protein n=1 Tax=Elysia marginata TaxID=1093978 RepID=A0AAV4GL21_9GAST|nr:hypothetical protein ElyMa_006035800 [Elysia marginata]
MDKFKTPSARTTTRSLSTSSLTIKENTPRPRQSLPRQVSEDTRRKLSFRNRPEAGRIANSTKKISDLYKNPQLYAGVWQKQLCQWSFHRSCLQIVPVSIAIQFCAVSAALFSVPSLLLHGMSQKMAALTFLLSGFCGVICITLFRTLIKRFHNQRGMLVRIVIAFIIYFIVGVILVFLANVRILKTLSDLAINKALTSGNGINSTWPQDWNLTSPIIEQNPSTLVELERISFTHTVSENVPVIFKIIAFVGFAILGTSVGSGQYLLHSVAMTSAHSDRHQVLVSIATLAAAGGGCFICIISSADISGANSDSSLQRIAINIAILCGVNIFLLVLSVVCFILAWHLEMRDLRHSITNYSAAPPKSQRVSRSPQEIFDECAHLLGHHTPRMPRSPYHHRPPKYYDPTQQRFVPRLPSTGSLGYHTDGSAADASVVGAQERWSRRISKKLPPHLLDRQETLSNASEGSEATTAFDESTALNFSSEILKRYNYAVPRVKDSNNHRLRGNSSLFSSSSNLWKMILILFLCLCLSSSMLSFEYSATSYLSAVAEAKTSSIFCNLDLAVRRGSSGLLLSYVAFAVGAMLHCKFRDRTGWKKLTLAICLVFSLLTLLLTVLRDTPGLFLLAAFTHGLLKVMVVALPHLLMLQGVRSQGGHPTEKRQMLLIEGSTCFLWCMMPVSVALSGITAGPLAYATGRIETPMMYSACPLPLDRLREPITSLAASISSLDLHPLALRLPTLSVLETLLPYLSSPCPLKTMEATTARLASLGIPARRRQHLENGDDNIKACSKDVLVAVPTADDR